MSEIRKKKAVVGERVLAKAGRCAGPFGRRGIARLFGGNFKGLVENGIGKKERDMYNGRGI